MPEPRSTSAPAPAIQFTGQRINHSFRVFVNGEPIVLSSVSFTLLIRLVVARACAGTGHIACARMPICRLREALAKIIGDDRAKALIESGAGNEYRLGISRADLKQQIGVTRAFFELVDLGIVSKKDAARLRRATHHINKGVFDE